MIAFSKALVYLKKDNKQIVLYWSLNLVGILRYCSFKMFRKVIWNENKFLF